MLKMRRRSSPPSSLPLLHYYYLPPWPPPPLQRPQQLPSFLSTFRIAPAVSVSTGSTFEELLLLLLSLLFVPRDHRLSSPVTAPLPLPSLLSSLLFLFSFNHGHLLLAPPLHPGARFCARSTPCRIAIGSGGTLLAATTTVDNGRDKCALWLRHLLKKEGTRERSSRSRQIDT